MKKIFCDYSKELHEHLRVRGFDVSDLDSLLERGYEINFIGSHHTFTCRNVVGFSGSVHECDGTYLDNGFTKVRVEDFREAFCNDKYRKGCADGC